MPIKIEQFVNSVFSSNTYVVSDGCDALILDLGDLAPVASYVESNGLNVRALMLTHTHYDHIYGIRAFMEEFSDAPVYTSHFGVESLTNPRWNFSRYHNDPISITSERIHALDDGEILRPFGDCRIEVIATPGHDQSCLSFRVEDALFTGDSYIPGIKVIATFPKSDKALAARWYEKLQQMSASMNTFPGHGSVILNILKTKTSGC